MLSTSKKLISHFYFFLWEVVQFHSSFLLYVCSCTACIHGDWPWRSTWYRSYKRLVDIKSELGIKHGSSVRTASALNNRAISPFPGFNLCAGWVISSSLLLIHADSYLSHHHLLNKYFWHLCEKLDSCSFLDSLVCPQDLRICFYAMLFLVL